MQKHPAAESCSGVFLFTGQTFLVEITTARFEPRVKSQWYGCRYLVVPEKATFRMATIADG